MQQKSQIDFRKHVQLTDLLTGGKLLDQLHCRSLVNQQIVVPTQNLAQVLKLESMYFTNNTYVVPKVWIFEWCARLGFNLKFDLLLM